MIPLVLYLAFLEDTSQIHHLKPHDNIILTAGSLKDCCKLNENGISNGMSICVIDFFEFITV